MGAVTLSNRSMLTPPGTQASGLAELCNFARCYEDVYMVENQSTQMTAFSAIFFGMYVCCFISAYFVSRCHLRFVEKLYFQRHKAKVRHHASLPVHVDFPLPHLGRPLPCVARPHRL